jgi:hypothetical protein
MQYLLLIYEDESVYGDKSGKAMQEVVPRHMKLVSELGAARLGGAGLHPTHTAKTVQTKAGKQTVHDGPFAETREQLGGFYLIDVPDLDAAIAVAKKMPVYKDGSIEIRAVLPPPAAK